MYTKFKEGNRKGRNYMGEGKINIKMDFRQRGCDDAGLIWLTTVRNVGFLSTPY